MNSLVSIIMPCHNGAAYISDAIQSVLSQTYSDWELLVVDDNSIDDSVKIIETFCKKDSRVKLFRSEKSSGMPATPRNVGIRNAAGRYIAFLDCDDIWLPTKLARQIPLFAVKNVAVVFSCYGKMDADESYHSQKIDPPLFVSYKNLLKGNCIGNLTAIYDSEKCGKIYQREIHHEDYVMWLEILAKGFYAQSTGTVESVYRESASSVSGSKLKAFVWTWRIYRKELGFPFFSACKYFFHYVRKAVFKFMK